MKRLLFIIIIAFAITTCSYSQGTNNIFERIKRIKEQNSKILPLQINFPEKKHENKKKSGQAGLQTQNTSDNPSSPVTQQWAAKYGSDYSDFVRAIAPDNSGNVYVTGSDGSSFDGVMTVTIKYNSSGDSVWVARRPSSSPSSIAVDNFGNVYVTGGDYNIDGDSKFLTIKYNSNGVFQWEQIYGGSSNLFDFSLALSLDAFGNVCVTGISYDVGFDFLTIKYNSSGVQQWVSRYSAPGNFDTFFLGDIGVDVSNNVYVSNSIFINDTVPNYITIKYNSSGVQQWVSTYGGATGGLANKMTVDNSGNVIVTGGTSDIAYKYGLGTVKYNTNGVQQWVREYFPAFGSSNGGMGVKTDISGNIFITGDGAEDDSFDYSDYVTIKYDAGGNTLWIAKYSGIIHSGDLAYALVMDNSGDVYVTGISSTLNDLNFEFTTVKYSSSGVEKWVARYANSATANSIAHIIAVDDLSNVYVSGYSDNVTTNQDFATVKYVQDIPLPVELASFTSTVNNNNLTLNWSTSAETNNSGFDIERSSTVNNEWSKIGFVEGNGTSSTQNSYSFPDRDLKTGRYNYRLKQIDFNGNFEYFNLGSEVSIGIPDKFKLSQNYPNPFNPSTKINYDLPADGKVNLTLFDISGREVATIVNEVQQAGYYSYTFNGANLSSGIYFYKIQTEQFSETKRMMLIK